MPTETQKQGLYTLNVRTVKETRGIPLEKAKPGKNPNEA